MVAVDFTVAAGQIFKKSTFETVNFCVFGTRVLDRKSTTRCRSRDARRTIFNNFYQFWQLERCDEQWKPGIEG